MPTPDKAKKQLYMWAFFFGPIEPLEIKVEHLEANLRMTL